MGLVGVTVIELNVAVTVMLSAFVTDWAVGVVESVTRMEKLNVPVAVAVPVMVPLGLRFKPAGKVPEASDQLYGEVPPEAPTLLE
jgi:hypothetical protein